MLKPKHLFAVIAIFVAVPLLGQDLENYLPGDSTETPQRTEKTFRATRIVNLHSVELPQPGEMVLHIGHRFGNLNSGLYEMFGLDQATMRLGMDLGLLPWLAVGYGRSTYQKSYDVFAKARIWQQSNGGSTPVTVTGYLSANQTTLKDIYPSRHDNFEGRLTTVSSIMIARKFSDRFSLQISPMWLHAAYLPEAQKATSVLALGTAARIKLTGMTHMNIEYITQNEKDRIGGKDVLSAGFDIETGGHVFQLFVSNTQGISDKAYLTSTFETWADKAVFFGFNITRAFYIKKKQQYGT